MLHYRLVNDYSGKQPVEGGDCSDVDTPEHVILLIKVEITVWSIDHIYCKHRAFFPELIYSLKLSKHTIPYGMFVVYKNTRRLCFC